MSHPQDRAMLHPLRDSMRLIAWHVSALDLNRRDFLNGLPVMCSNPGVLTLLCSIPRKSFCSKCGPKQVDPLSTSLGVVCDFRTEQFETENKAYSTTNSYRSALSSILPPFEGRLLGEHPVIVRLLMGMYVSS